MACEAFCVAVQCRGVLTCSFWLGAGLYQGETGGPLDQAPTP